MRIKKIVTVLFVVILLSLSITSYAHTTSQSGILQKASNLYPHYIGGEAVGWIINENCHTNGYYLRYHYMSPSQALISLVNNASISWSYAGGCPLHVEESSASGGTITEEYLPDDTDALFTPFSRDVNTGHLISWKIAVNIHNLSVMNYGSLVHEFGHAVGLVDLESASNKYKIMYNDANERMVSDPQTQDKWGVRVIIGDHATHSWEYKFYKTNSSGVNQHRRRCSSCKGIKYNSVENCTINNSGYCTKCGHAGNSGTQSIGLPEVTGMSLWEDQRRAFRFLIV